MKAACPRCKASFRCGRDTPAGCWCGRVGLQPGALTELADRYQGCLCPSCLALEARAPASEIGSRDRG